MPCHLLRKARGLPTAALLLSIMVFVSGWTPSYGDSAQASRLLKNARGLAVQLGRDANQMASFQTLTDWKSHAEQLNLIADHINKIGKISRICTALEVAPNPGNRMPSTRSPPSSRNWHPTPSRSSKISMAIKGRGVPNIRPLEVQWRTGQ